MNFASILKLPARAVIVLIRGYQYLISPLLPQTCRFYPTCSAYTIEAIKRYGTLRGGFKGLWRVLRCHPLSQGGYDPVA